MKKDKKNKKAKKHDHEAISAESDTKHAQGEPKSTAKSSPKSDDKVDALVREIIERVADKWTMVVRDVLARRAAVVGEEARQILLGLDVLAGVPARDAQVEEDAGVSEELVGFEEGITSRRVVALMGLRHAAHERRAGLVARGVGGCRGRPEEDQQR